MPMTADEMIYRLLLREWIALEDCPDYCGVEYMTESESAEKADDIAAWHKLKVDLVDRTQEALGEVSIARR